MSAHKRLDPYADRGADGQAMASRPFVMATVEDDTAGEDGARRFTRTEVKRLQDDVISMFAGRGILTGARLDAAVELARLYEAGRIAPTGYRSGEGGGGEMSDERAEAWAAYCAALDRVPRRCQDACMDVARNRWPTDMNAVANMRDGFAALAAVWKMG